MTSFRFRLQKVLDLRHTQLEVEETRFKQQLAAQAALDTERAGWEAAGIKAEIQVRDFNQLAGCDLTALGNFRLNVKQQERQIDARRLEGQKGLEAQQSTMLEARRRCRLLERLKDRRLAEWTSARDHELEQLASESFMAKWGR
ncbi:MAG TPA: hypothetical protein VNY05_38045 [Candidatus Acidoferrales bacterium]|jgi:hypothetical protein|nr:hypothetical protein [Candidatus Acidoferrales bacterium]